ncbi:MAG TPA: hypothetical protein VF789_22450 [Thermoanaerobaculia bacterium]
MKADEHPVQPEKLAELIGRADKIVVFESPMEGAEVLFSSTDPRDIREFRDSLALAAPPEGFHCMCIGEPAVRLYREGKELALVTNHHGNSVRSSLWTSDAIVKDPEKWLAWFDARKIPGPRREFEGMMADEKNYKKAYERWLAAMPKSVEPLWDEVMEDEFSPDLEPARKALAKEFPDVQPRILALFAWYGSGDGPWSGFPSYESVAEELLLDFPTPDLIAAAQSENLSESQIEGAARLFGGWEFSQRRPDDRKNLPAPLKARLLEHSLKSTDADKLGRARSAFAPS